MSREPAPKDPHVGWYEYRGARFQITRYQNWGGFKYYCDGVAMPWERGTLTGGRGGGFSWSATRLIDRIKRRVDGAYRKREINGLPTHVGAEVERWGLKQLPDRDDREYAVIE